MTITASRYATEDSDRRETNINADNINTKVGEVQATPTQYTVLDRLKTIASNTATPPNITLTENLYTVTLSFQRPANTTSYAIGDIMNDATNNLVLPSIDFGIGNANKKIDIQSYVANTDSNKTTPALPTLYFFNTSTIGAQNLTDNQAYNPAYTDVIANKVCQIEPTLLSLYLANGSNGYSIMKSDFKRYTQIASDGKLYVAIVHSTTYGPMTGERWQYKFKGKIY